MNPKLFWRGVLILGVLIVALLAVVVRLGTLFVAATRPFPTVRRPDWVEPYHVPEPGEPGAETWLNGTKPGTPGVGKVDAWAPYAADPELGLAYIPSACP